MSRHVYSGALVAMAVLLISSLVTQVSAQQMTLDIQPRTLRLNETATLKLTFININPPQSPSLPEMPGFQVSYVGQEQQFQFNNGRQEQRLSFNYRLQPMATGQFKLGPFALNFAGQTMNFDEIMMEVLPPSTAAPGTGQDTIDDLVFARIQLPRNEVFLQERFDVELMLYFRGIQIDRNIQLQNLPSTGINLDEFQELGSTREAVNNEIYEVRRFRMRGTAITAGTFTLDPMVRVQVLVRRERSRDPFFGGFDDVFFGRYEAQPLVVPVEPVPMVVRSLPGDGRPDNFGGAVGVFSMDMEAQPRELTAGDPVTLTVRITGKGNFENISMPRISFGDDFRVYDPKLTAANNEQKIFEQVIIPRNERIKELPSVSFTYFDPQKGSYETIVRGPLPLVVKAGIATQPQLVQVPAGAAASISRAPLGIDIIGPKRAPASWPSPTSLESAGELPSPYHLAPLAALFVAMAFRKRRESFDRDVTKRRRSQAPSSARAAIRQAEAALRKQDPAAFHAAIWKAFADYTANRCNLEAGEVSPDLIRDKTANGGLSAEHLKDLASILAACDEARFSKTEHPDPAILQGRLQRTQEILRACERIPFS